jgi:hypothetical protein
MIHGDACFAYFNKIWGIPLACCFRTAQTERYLLPSSFKLERRHGVVLIGRPALFIWTWLA